MDNLLYSIIIPTYNRRNIVFRTIQSILIQSYTNYEIIVIDDGSNDGTAQFLGKIACNSKFHLITLGENFGVNIAKNIGAINAKGDYLIFLDSDDSFLDFQSLMTLNHEIEVNNFPKVAMFSCINMYNNLTGNSINQSRKLDFKEYFCNSVKGEYLPVILRKEFLKVKFNESIRGGEHITWKLLVMECNEILISSKIVRLYDNLSKDRLSIRTKKNKRRILKVYFLDLKIFFWKYIRVYPLGLIILIFKIFIYSILSL